MAPRLDVYGLTDVGRHRRKNEDAIDWDVALGLAMVADGMGGNRAGEIASATALRSIRTDLSRALGEPWRRDPRAGSRELRGALVVELVRRANQAVRRAANRDQERTGMGTTLALALFGTDFVTVAHVGDSRVYRWRAGTLKRLTTDHSMVQEMIDRGQLDAGQAARSRHRNVITRALGPARDVQVDVAHHALRPGDVYLLCTDGLTGMLPDRELADSLGAYASDMRAAARRFVELANARGGRDNISVVLMRISEGSS